jgi:hypothetical protein
VCGSALLVCRGDTIHVLRVIHSMGYCTGNASVLCPAIFHKRGTSSKKGKSNMYDIRLVAFSIETLLLLTTWMGKGVRRKILRTTSGFLVSEKVIALI